MPPHKDSLTPCQWQGLESTEVEDHPLHVLPPSGTPSHSSPFPGSILTQGQRAAAMPGAPSHNSAKRLRHVRLRLLLPWIKADLGGGEWLRRPAATPPSQGQAQLRGRLQLWCLECPAQAPPDPRKESGCGAQLQLPLQKESGCGRPAQASHFPWSIMIQGAERGCGSCFLTASQQLRQREESGQQRCCPLSWIGVFKYSPASVPQQVSSMPCPLWGRNPGTIY